MFLPSGAPLVLSFAAQDENGVAPRLKFWPRSNNGVMSYKMVGAEEAKRTMLCFIRFQARVSWPYHTPDSISQLRRV